MGRGTTLSDGCIFCDVVAGRRKDEIVYEDAAVLAFLDRLRQPSPGHVLVIPKEHTESIWTIDPRLGTSLLRAAQVVAKALRDALGYDGVTLWVSNGPGAGQEVFHFHLHVFPRRRGDGFFHVYPEFPPPVPGAEKLAELAELIRSKVREPTVDSGP